MNTIKNIIANGGGDILAIAKNIIDNPILEESLKWAQQNAIPWKDRSALNKNFVAKKRTENGFILEKKDLDAIRVLAKRPFKEWVVYSDILSELFGYACADDEGFAYGRDIIDTRVFSREWDNDETLARFFKSVVNNNRATRLKVECLDEKNIKATILFEYENNEGVITKEERVVIFTILEEKMRANKRKPIGGFHGGFDIDDDEKQEAFTKAMGNIFSAYRFFVDFLYEILNITNVSNHFVFDEVAVKMMRFLGGFHDIEPTGGDYSGILTNNVISSLRNDKRLLEIFDTFAIHHPKEDGPFVPAVDFLNRLEVCVLSEKSWDKRRIIYDRVNPLDFIIKFLIFGVAELPKPDKVEIFVRENAIGMYTTSNGEANAYEIRHWHTDMVAVPSVFNPCVEE